MLTTLGAGLHTGQTSTACCHVRANTSMQHRPCISFLIIRVPYLLHLPPSIPTSPVILSTLASSWLRVSCSCSSCSCSAAASARADSAAPRAASAVSARRPAVLHRPDPIGRRINSKRMYFMGRHERNNADRLSVLCCTL